MYVYGRNYLLYTLYFTYEYFKYISFTHFLYTLNTSPLFISYSRELSDDMRMSDTFWKLGFFCPLFALGFLQYQYSFHLIFIYLFRISLVSLTNE